jgi:hypothetical protein
MCTTVSRRNLAELGKDLGAPAGIAEMDGGGEKLDKLMLEAYTNPTDVRFDLRQ